MFHNYDIMKSRKIVTYNAIVFVLFLAYENAYEKIKFTMIHITIYIVNHGKLYFTVMFNLMELGVKYISK